ncbi:4Fe-4S dicluster domain-containing protein [Desulfobacterales bacterium HSG16]|nr:4Fe-4S dicluster domain-containing protein [Desulfobacterales bacterium HSG16]
MKMEWTQEAEAALKKVPFFVRKKVRSRVEKETMESGKQKITLTEVKAAQARFLSTMESEIKGYNIDTCFGQAKCPNRLGDSKSLIRKIEDLFIKSDLLSFLKSQVEGPLKFHHEFRMTIADCPNACSQPQIKDIGIIGSRTPFVTNEDCDNCGICVETCKEHAIKLAENSQPVIDCEKCLHCGQCISLCPTHTIAEANIGFRVLMAGKLGRHPRLARELSGILSENDVIDIISESIEFYKNNSTGGRRFSHIFTDTEFERLENRYARKC